MFAYGAMIVTQAVLCAAKASLNVQIDQKSPLPVEFGKMVDLRCNATGCPEQPSFTWRTVDDKPFKPTKDENGFISFKTEVLTNIELVCKAKCKDYPVEKKIKLVVYSFSGDPEISGEDNLAVGVQQNLTCTARDLYPADEVSIEWEQENKTVLDEDPQRTEEQGGKSTVTSNYTFIPTAQDNGRYITCRVIQNIPAGRAKMQKERTRSVPLAVTLVYLSNIYISGRQNLSIGETLALTCNSEGNPMPVTEWTKAGNVLDGANDGTISIRNITWSHAGQYDCEANNSAGSKKSSVNVTIQGPPSGTQVRVFPSTELVSGQNVTITCTALHSFPPATFTLFRQDYSQPLQSGDGTFYLSHLSHEDTGSHLINITNHLGYAIETFQLSISSSTTLPPAVLPTVGSMSFLTALLLLLRFLRSRKRSDDISSGIADVVENVL